MTSSAESTPVLVSIIANVGSEEGHHLPYNQAAGQAARQLGWDHLAAIPTTCAIRELPAGWRQTLHRVTYRPVRGGQLGQRDGLPEWTSVWRSAQTIRAYLQDEVLPREQPAILFMEFFIFAHLLALVLAVFGLPRQQVSVWLLYGLNLQMQPTRSLYRLLHGLLERLLGGRLTLLTDNAQLVAPLTNVFRRPVHVVPIPLASTDEAVSAPALPAPAPGERPVLAWWPGAVRADKGLDRLHALAHQTGSEARRVWLAASEGAALTATPGGCRVLALPAALPRPAYLGWMQAADLVLLPYALSSYAGRTSGIFVEAIAAGKPAPVTAGTWMAHEALAHNLPELVVDWDGEEVWPALFALTENADVARRLQAMQAHYQAYHSVAGYAACMAELWQR
jgi:hypothetical protein